MAYRVFVDVWRLACRYRFQKLENDEWESLISDGNKLFDRYKDTYAECLFRYLFQAIQSFYESVGKEP